MITLWSLYEIIFKFTWELALSCTPTLSGVIKPRNGYIIIMIIIIYLSSMK